MNVLIDTNVILDAVMNREPFAAAAQEIFIKSAENKINASITANSVTDIYYLVRKHLQSTEQAKQVLYKLFSLFNILDICKSDCVKALELKMNDYEDALLSVCAKKINAEWIITRNTKHFQNSPVPAIAPEDFLRNHYIR